MKTVPQTLKSTNERIDECLDKIVEIIQKDESVPPAQPVVCTPGNNPLLPAGADGASNATAFCTSFTGRC